MLKILLLTDENMANEEFVHKIGSAILRSLAFGQKWERMDALRAYVELLTLDHSDEGNRSCGVASCMDKGLPLDS